MCQIWDIQLIDRGAWKNQDLVGMQNENVASKYAK